MLKLSHKNLDVYQIAKKLVKELYEVTSRFPKEELFGITRQLRRASVSVASNIVEGAARKSKKEKKRFYEVSRSSVVEIDTQFEISLLLNYINEKEVIELEKYIESVFRILSKMISNLDPPTSH